MPIHTSAPSSRADDRRAAARARWSRVLLAFVVLFTALYRFNPLGGSMAGFDNDHFVHFAYARQVLAGEQPLRDFAAVGLKGVPPSLTFEASAAVSRWFGDNLRSEALLSVAAMAVAAGLTYAAAAAVAPAVIAAACVLLGVFEAPKLYNYPKVLVFAATAWLVVAYSRRPTAARAAGMGALIAVAFLFRHDYAAYAGVALAVATVAGAGSLPRAVGHLAISGAVALALLTPSLWYVQAREGLVVYLRDGLEISGREAAHTDLEWPLFTRADEDGRSVSRTDMSVEQNAIAALYYIHLALPAVVLVMAFATRRAPNTAVARSVLVPLAVGALVAMPFLLRGNLGARFGDIAPLMSVLLAGGVALAAGAWPAETSLARLVRVALAAVVVIATARAIWTVGSVRTELDASGWSDSAGKIVKQAHRRWSELGALPAAYWTDPEATGSIRAAQYLNQCTRRDDRVLVMTYAPEVVGLSGRLFAAGLSRVIPEEFSSSRHQRVAVDRWKRQSVPIVLAEDVELYAEYPQEFALLDKYLHEHYEFAGPLELDGGHVMRVFARRMPGPTGTFRASTLPCFGEVPAR